MAVVNMSELPDLDSLLNAGESQGSSICSSLDENGAFDPNEFAGVVKWCHEQSKTFQLHYDQHLENQKRKLAKENEDSLLETLQQTLQNFESDPMSAMANMSSLSREGDLDKPCMLKEILLSPFSDRYSRERNSPEHVNKGIVEYGNFSPCLSGPNDSKFVKPKPNKGLNNFSELRKHMEATNADRKRIHSQNTTILGGTRLVSSRQYMNKYGPQVVTSSNQTETPSKRVVVHPVGIGGGKNGTGNKRQTLTLELKSSTAAKILDGKSKVMIHNPGTSTVKAIGVASSPVVVKAKPNGIPVPIKRPHSAAAVQIPTKKICLNVSPGDHDYCSEHTVSSPSQKSPTDALKETVKPNQKVVKWNDYVRQRREGVRSAPNSPLSSPRVAKGSGRPSNNFMVVSLHSGHMPAKLVVNSTAGKSQSAVPLPLPLKKDTVKAQFELQEFNKYITDLKDNLSSPKTSPPVASSEVCTNDFVSSKSVSASQSLAALAQQHQRKSMENDKAVDKNKIHASTPQRSSVDQCTSSDLNSDKTTSNGVPAHARASQQLLMIKVPVSSSSKSILPPVQSPARICNQKTDIPVINNHGKPLSQTTSEISSQNKANEHAESNEVPKSPPKNCGDTVKPNSSASSPTFKLMTCSKAGGEGKSLILSGVSGQLKDILTKLAEQQAKSKAEGKNKGTDSDEQQIAILKNLISCVTSNKNENLQETGVNGSATELITASSDAQPSPSKDVSASTTMPVKNFVQTHEKLPKPASQHLVEPSVQMDGDPTIPNPSELPDCKPTTAPPNHTIPVPISQQASVTATSTVDQSTGPIKGEICPETATAIAYPVSQNQPYIVNGASGVDPYTALMDNAGSLGNTQTVPHVNTKEEDIIYKFDMDELNQSNTNPVANDNDPAVITLEEALIELNADDEVDSNVNQSGDMNCPNNENLFCKIPSYFMNGKVLKEVPPKEMDVTPKQGLKQESSDPLIGIKAEEDLGFNKLPHYFSSGKPSHDHSVSADESTSRKRENVKGYAVKLNPVGEGQHLTPQGAPVDSSQTYYSRLPSYYSYGRPHPPVKTFNDEVADAKDDTVTPETLESEKNDSKRERRSKKKKMKKKKKRKSKRNDKNTVDEVSKKIEFSKLPHYYVSSKVVRCPSGNDHPPSPSLSSTSRSSSPYSNYSRSSRSRSRSYSRSPCRGRRYRSRSYSRSPSYSSDSDSNPRRSWRHERSSISSRNGRSFDRRNRNCSNEELDDFRWRREREVKTSKRQQRDKQEKDNQQAMEERRIVYVGGIEDKMTKQELRNKFLKFGNIELVSLFFRNDGDNYGFLTFQYTCDAFRAIENGADLAPAGSRYDLCFGGRRQFCKSRYQDLDSRAPPSTSEDSLDFDALLKRALKTGLRR